MTTRSGRLECVDGKWRVRDASTKKRGVVKSWAGTLSLDTAQEGTKVDYDDHNGQVKNVRRHGEIVTAPVVAVAAPAAAVPVDDSKFVNPYTFIPWVDRTILPRDLLDGEPAGHDRLRPDRWTGTIEIEIEVVTPLLLLDTARATLDNNRHRTVPVRLDVNNQPELAPTALKGALRSCYEAITGSRFGVFNTKHHDTRLAYRMAARDGLRSVPARVRDAPGGRVLELLTGTTFFGDQGIAGQFLHAAWVPAYNGGPARALSGVSRDDHKKAFWAMLEPMRHGANNQSFNYWGVRSLATTEAHLPALDVIHRSAISGSHSPLPGEALRVAKGWLCWTNKNFPRKHDERFFFGTGPVISAAETARLAESWHEVISSYKAAHEGTLERGRDGLPLHDAGPGKPALSPHQYEDARQALSDGQLVYVWDDQAFANTLGLIPVTIARRVFDKSPTDQVPPMLRPARQLSELSAADRVFGWVNSDGSGAHKGQLRIRQVEFEAPPPGGEAVREFVGRLPLAALSSPKPAQGRFYLGKADGAGLGPLNRTRTELRSLYTDQTRVRGWKAYWHHRDRDASWPGPGTAEAQGSYESTFRGDQNTSVTGWVEPGTTFRALIEVKNLNDLELGALLWLTQHFEGGCHRLGFAKPLGFGSVRIKQVDKHLARGGMWKDRWRNLAGDGSLPQEDSTTALDLYAVAASGPLREPTKALIAVASGLANANVSYPRLSHQHGHDDLFRWFMENGKGHKYALPLATADDPRLPRDPNP